jgi:hypothetical protein
VVTEAEYLAKLTALADADCVISRIGLEVFRGRAEARGWVLRMADRIGLAHEILANLAERKAKMTDEPTTAELRDTLRTELDACRAERDQLRQQLDRVIAGEYSAKFMDLEQQAGEILDAEIKDRKPAEYAYQDALSLPGLCERIIKDRDRLRAMLTRLIPESAEVPDTDLIEFDWRYIVRCRPGRTDTCEGITLGELRAALAPKEKP